MKANCLNALIKEVFAMKKKMICNKILPKEGIAGELVMA